MSTAKDWFQTEPEQTGKLAELKNELSENFKATVIPLSATPEYKQMMELKNQYPDIYKAVKKDIGTPDSAEACNTFIAAMNGMIQK